MNAYEEMSQKLLEYPRDIQSVILSYIESGDPIWNLVDYYQEFAERELEYFGDIFSSLITKMDRSVFIEVLSSGLTASSMAFLKKYCELHKEKFGEDFLPSWRKGTTNDYFEN